MCLYEELAFRQHAQRIVEAQPLHLRPLIVTAAQGLVTQFYQFLVPAFSHSLIS